MPLSRSGVIKDRLDMQKRMKGMVADVRKVADLPDPVGKYSTSACWRTA
jgi:gamma-glutamyl phosphate reductase